MSFTVTRANGKETTNATSWSVTLPASSTGDLLIIGICWDWVSGDAITWPSGWTSLGSDNNTSVAADCRYKICDGSEGTTLSLTVGPTGQQAVWRVWRIAAASWDSGQVPEAVTTDHGATTGPDPATLTPTGGAKDYLWLVFLGTNLNVSTGTATISAYPANVTAQQGSDSTATTGGALGAWCELESNAASLNPSAFTVSAAEGAISFVVAVHPSAVTIQNFQYQNRVNTLLRM